MQASYRYLQDPGHGWIEVPIAELTELGIADKITPYSYVGANGTMVYLEEDLDAYTWLNAHRARSNDPMPLLKSEHTNGQSFVRGLPPYSAPQPAAARPKP